MSLMMAAFAGAAIEISKNKSVQDAAAGILTNIVSTPFGNAFSSGTKLVWDRLIQSQKANTLPANHHLERATTRAALLATSRSLATIPEADRHLLADLLEGPQPGWWSRVRALAAHWLALGRKAGGTQPYPRQNYASIHALLVWYSSLAGRLTAGRAGDRVRLKLIEQGRLETYSASLSKAASAELARINAPQPPDHGGQQELAGHIAEMRRATEGAVLDQIVARGTWDAARQAPVRDALRQALFGPAGTWWQAFALFYAEEVRSDPEMDPILKLLQLEAIEGKLDEALSQLAVAERIISAAHEEQIKALREIRSNFLLQSMAVFYEPAETMKKDGSEIRSFYFAEQFDTFVGRQDVISQIEDSLLTFHDAMPKFAWASIVGCAGSGKSRLALELRDSNSGQWPLSGFVSSAFLREFRGSDIKVGAFDRPTLFILDYAGGNPAKCEEFIARCAVVAEHSDHPIRALVLVRQTNDPFFQFVNDSRNGSPAINSREDFDQLVAAPESFHIDPATRAIVLGPLGDADLRQMMRNRMGAAQDAGKDPLDLLKDYDPDMRRPLIALLLADAEREGRQTQEAGDVSRELRLLNLLQDHIRRQFLVNWREIDGDYKDLTADQQRRIDRHLSFLMLATCCRDFTDAAWLDLLDDPGLKDDLARLIPLRPDSVDAPGGQGSFHALTRDRLQALSGQRFDPFADVRYPIMEPDLYAEALLLLMLGANAQDVALDPGTVAARRTLLAVAAWATAPGGMAGFISLVDQDFPMALARLDWCLPLTVTDANRQALCQLLEFLIRNRLEAFTRHPATLDDIQAIERLFAHFERASPASPSARAAHARSLALAAKYLGGMINEQAAHVAIEKRKPLVLTTMFDQAPASAETMTEQADADQPELVQKVNAPANNETLQKVGALLRSILEQCLPQLFGDDPLAVRDKYAEAVCYVLTSMLWKNRANDELGGKYLHPLLDEEIAKRDEIAALATQQLQTRADHAAIACSLLARVIYAEWDGPAERGMVPLAAIRNYASTGLQLEGATLRSFMSALPNLHFLCAAQGFAPGDSEALARGHDILNLARTMIRSAARIAIADVTLSRNIANNFADLLQRQSDLWQRAEWADDPETYLGDYAAFVVEKPQIKVPQAVLLFVVLLLSRNDDAGGPAEVDSQTILTVLDRRLAVSPGEPNDWIDLPFITARMVAAQPRHQALVRVIAYRLVSDIGPRAIGVLVEQIARASLPEGQGGESRLDLISLATGRVETADAPADLAEAIIRSCARSLLDGTEDRVWEIAEQGRFGSGSADLVADRATAISLFEMLRNWASPSDLRVRSWIQQVFDDPQLHALLQEPAGSDSDLTVPGESEELLRHELVLLARRELHGLPGDTWWRILGAPTPFAATVRGRLASRLARNLHNQKTMTAAKIDIVVAWIDLLGAPLLKRKLFSRTIGFVGQMLLGSQTADLQDMLTSMERLARREPDGPAGPALRRCLDLVTRWYGSVPAMLLALPRLESVAASFLDGERV